MLQHRCNTNLTNVTSHTRRHPITLVDDEYLVCFCVCPPNEIPCWRLFQNLKVTDKTHKSGKQLAKILFEHYDTFLQQNARETNLRDMWRDANPHCCKIISLAHNGMNWCDLYWFSSWDDDTSLHSFFIQRVWLAVHLHFDAPRKTHPEIQAWCTTKPKSKLDSFNSSNLGPVFKPLPENYPLNKKLTFTHFQWDPTISNSMAWIFLSFSQGEKLLLFQLDPRSVTSFPAQLRFLAWQCHGQTWSLNQPLMVMGGCQRLQCVPEKHFPIIVANKNILYSWGMGYHGYQHWYMTVQRLLSPVITFSNGNHSDMSSMDRNVSTWNSGVDGTHTRHMINMNHFAVPLVPFSAKWPVQRKRLDIFSQHFTSKIQDQIGLAIWGRWNPIGKQGKWWYTLLNVVEPRYNTTHKSWHTSDIPQIFLGKPAGLCRLGATALHESLTKRSPEKRQTRQGRGQGAWYRSTQRRNCFSFVRYILACWERLKVIDSFEQDKLWPQNQ